ncbi:MAG: hypothetical protein L7F78_22665 [Syntrophales bacterium LBB04]|nr:hypothetical protein [Syntrophales bacterium LBB04]
MNAPDAEQSLPIARLPFWYWLFFWWLGRPPALTARQWLIFVLVTNDKSFVLVFIRLTRIVKLKTRVIL